MKESQNIQGRNIAQRYNKYLKDRAHRTKTKSEDSFPSKLSSSRTSTTPAVKHRVESRSQARSSKYRLPNRQIHAKNISLKHATRLAKYAPIIQSASERYGVPIELICGVILQESGGNPRARSHCGARGLMQLMPATARRFGVKNSYDPAQNIEGGVKYLRFLLDRFNGNLELVAAGYNAGEGNVAKYGNKIPPFRETQNYVPAVLGFTKTMMKILKPVQLATVAEPALPSHARRA